MKQLLKENDLILMEAAILEQLRRSNRVTLHPRLENALLIYDDQGREALKRLYQSYIEIALASNLPFLLCAPTWRANQARINEAHIQSDVNGDAVEFMQEIRTRYSSSGIPIMLGGLIGCQNDCYQPDQALSSEAAQQFHGWQINRLARAGVDFLMAATLPSVQEAIGIAKAMETTKIPYLISFVINQAGQVLDGTSLAQAVEMVDSAVMHRPLGYIVNCAYPAFLCADQQPAILFERLLGFQANASSLNHSELERASQVKADDLTNWGETMLKLNREFGVKILGGCCGTGEEHLEYLVDNYTG